MSVVTVAVPSGRLLEGGMRTLEAAGYLTAGTWRSTRRLILPCADGAVRCLIAKPVDLLAYVEHGAADLGIAGKDMLLEQGRDVYELVDLGFGFCRGVLAVPAGAVETWERKSHLRIATKYPRITERYFWRRGRPVEIIGLNGTVELAPQVGLADGIVDVVMTGRGSGRRGIVAARGRRRAPVTRTRGAGTCFGCAFASVPRQDARGRSRATGRVRHGAD